MFYTSRLAIVEHASNIQEYQLSPMTIKAYMRRRIYFSFLAPKFCVKTSSKIHLPKLYNASEFRSSMCSISHPVLRAAMKIPCSILPCATCAHCKETYSATHSEANHILQLIHNFMLYIIPPQKLTHNAAQRSSIVRIGDDLTDGTDVLDNHFSLGLAVHLNR